jgi:hypothetical protein
VSARPALSDAAHAVAAVPTHAPAASTDALALRRRAQHALERALAFLSSAQLATGEFPVLASIDPAMVDGCRPDPSVFPTALIAHALGFAPAAASLRARALDFLEAQMDSHGLWRHWTRDHPHFRQLPPDLDDTSCASAALSQARRRVPDNRALLLANRNRRGLFYTWITPRLRWTGAAHMKATLSQLRHAPTLYFFFRRTSAAPYDVDAVVNANTLFYLKDFAERQQVVDHLLAILRDGREASSDKWYENPFAIRYFLARALGAVAPEAGNLIAQRAASKRPRTALEAALAACSLFYCARVPDAASIGALLDRQLDTGAWPQAALYHGGRARLRDGSFAPPHRHTPHWGSAAVTTAFCVEALSRWSAEPAITTGQREEP